MIQTQNPGALDVVLIGAGIMSATLGTVLKELEPSLSITIFETLEDSGLESSQAWNNAGTGHSWNLVDDNPWRRAYVILSPGVQVPFVANTSVSQPS